MRKDTMTTALAVNKKAARHLVRYKEMCREIAACDKFDECKDIIDKSVAMAAYYTQIKDTETERMFHRIKMRAWRRIGELFSKVNTEDCITQTAKIKKIRSAFPDDPTVDDMSDSRIYEVLRLMRVSNSEFEHALQHQFNGSIVDLLRHTPSAMAEAEKAGVEAAKRTEENRKRDLAAQREYEMKNRHLNELDYESENAMKDVGITLELKHRTNIKQVVFLIKAPVHSVMRQAAFDKHITMQEVLRRGLKLWLEANGYEFPDDGVIQ